MPSQIIKISGKNHTRVYVISIANSCKKTVPVIKSGSGRFFICIFLYFRARHITRNIIEPAHRLISHK